MKTSHLLSTSLLVLGLIQAGSIAAGAAVLRVPAGYATLQEAVDAAAPGDTIKVGPGNFAGAHVWQMVNIEGVGDAVIDAPAEWTDRGLNLYSGSDGTTIRNLTFVGVDRPVNNAEGVSNVTVSHCTLVMSVQAITNWNGSGWEITHNEIIDLRTNDGYGGAGILIGDWFGGVAADNVVAHNRIHGTMYYDLDAPLGPGHLTAGIAVVAIPFGATGPGAVSSNVVCYNSVDLVSNKPLVVDVCALHFQDVRNDPLAEAVITDNAVMYNDLRGTALQMVLEPDNLDEVNFISRNLGENRGHGLHPVFFQP